MSFDSSRFTFNSWNDYFGVVMQQGRVQLDSDWNEWLAEFARRMQAGTLDIVGQSGVPSTSPDAFQIDASVDGSGQQHITIGPGRIYVDGLLAENHGPAGSAQWDPALGEWSGVPQIPGSTETDIDYTQQPYFPGATLLTGNGPFLVYLDVWQREVTYLEDPNLVEKAVGVDTTGRLQTVWQVKLLDVSSVAGVDSTTPYAVIPLWQDLIQSSASQVTTGVVPSASSGPCSLSPSTGYTGLENQLYRVEIHQAGVAFQQSEDTTIPPTATFKWSRDNASVATSVIAISPVTNSANNQASQLTVQSMGRDQVLGFNPGDWIEITDDNLEFNDQAGELHQIDSINSAAKTITLDSVVSPTNFGNGQIDPGLHTRIQRWDQSGTVYQSDGTTVWVNLDTAGSTGIPVPPSGTALILENGITVAFDLNQSGAWLGTQYTPTFETGDFWSFAARTADGSVQALVQAPPSGVKHHYCRLAIVNFNANPPLIGDCRQVFPPLANSCMRVTSVSLGSGAQFQNDGTVTVQDLSSGMNVVFDQSVDPAVITQPATTAWDAAAAYNIGQVVISGGNYYMCTATNTGEMPPNATYWAAVQFTCPVCSMTVDLPVPTAPPLIGFNFSPLTLSATVSVGPSNTINWTPTAAAQAALATQFSTTGLPLLAHLTLKGDSIWAKGNPGVYLNGAVVGVPAGTTGGPPTTALQLPSGDGRRCADFQMWFWLTSQPAVTLAPNTSLYFSPQLVGTSSTPQVVTLTFNGTTPGTMLTLTINPPTGDFTETDTYTGPMSAGNSCTFSFTFTPTAMGIRTGQITINETADSNPIVIMLTGTGLAPQVIASPTVLTFIQTVNTTSAPQTVTLTNTGNSPLTISGISVAGGAASDYLQTSNCILNGSGQLLDGASCTISVQFRPGAIGPRNAQLVINHDAAGSPLIIPLNGTGTNPVKTKDVVEKPIIRDIVKTTDVVKTTDIVKTTDTVKTTDIVKTADITKATEVKTRDLKVADSLKPSSSTGAPADVAGKGAKRRAFIKPQERPPVGSQTLSKPDDEPPKEGPKEE